LACRTASAKPRTCCFSCCSSACRSSTCLQHDGEKLVTSTQTYRYIIRTYSAKLHACRLPEALANNLHAYHIVCIPCKGERLQTQSSWPKQGLKMFACIVALGSGTCGTDCCASHVTKQSSKATKRNSKQLLSYVQQHLAWHDEHITFKPLYHKLTCRTAEAAPQHVCSSHVPSPGLHAGQAIGCPAVSLCPQPL